MSKSGSRYGRRSNWFKIHCLLQEQQHKSTNGNIQTNSIHMQNNYMPAHFLSNLCHNSNKHDTQITRSPSDSGASSADIDESNRDGSVESGKTEKSSSISSPSTIEQFRTSLSPYLPPSSTIATGNGRISAFFPVISNHMIPITTITTYSTSPQTISNLSNSITDTMTVSPTTTTATTTVTIIDQDEPIDLSVKSRKRRYQTPTPEPVVSAFDLPKPAPLDLTLVRARP